MTQMEKPTVEVMQDTEDMLGTLDEYTRKLVEAIQRGKEGATKQALPESGSIVAQAGHGRRRHLWRRLLMFTLTS